MKFEAGELVADAVLYDGDLGLGVIAPRRPSTALGAGPDADGEPWFSQTECLVRSNAETLVYVRARFVTAEGSRRVKRSADMIPVDMWREVTRCVSLAVDGLDAKLVLEVEPGVVESHGSHGASAIGRLRVRLENHETWRPEYASDRDAMLAKSLVSAHVLFHVQHGEFISLLEPAPDAESLAAACTNRHTWPVLAGDRSRHDVMLSSPIVLYDYPTLAVDRHADLGGATLRGNPSSPVSALRP